MIDTINNLIHQFIQETNLQPTELWLGPKEAVQFQQYLDKNVFFLQSDLPPLIEDGKTIYKNLTIKLMIKDGIRIGRTYAN